MSEINSVGEDAITRFTQWKWPRPLVGPHETISLLKMQVHNYTIGPTNWDHNEVSVINSLRGDAITRIVYGRTDGQTDNGVSHKLDWSRPVELTRPYMINRTLDLKNYNYRWMVMLDFMHMGSADLFGTGRERKIQNENMFPAGFGPTPRQSTTGKSARCAARPRWLDIM